MTGPSTLTGRDAEMARARSSFDGVDAGRGHAVVLAGEQGIGKTRMAQELLAEARHRGWLVLEGRGLALHATVPYGPIVEAFGRGLRALGDGERASVTAGLSALGRIFDDIGGDAPRDVAGPRGGGAGAGADTDTDRIRLFESVSRLLDRLSRLRPAVLLIDDLHWVDPASLEVLQHLCRDVASLPVLLIMTVRSDELDRAPGLRPVLATLVGTVPTERIELDRLGPAEVADLAASFARCPVPQDVTDWLVVRSAGTPLFVEVLLRDLLQRRVLVPAGDGLAVVGPLGTDPPAVLHDLLADRLVALPAQVREVLALIAVGASPVPHPLLAAVTGVPITDLDQALEALLATGLVVEQAVDGEELAYGCSHPVVAEVADGALSELARRRLHRSYLDALESSGTADLDRMARHCLAAGPLAGEERAVRLLADAGRRDLDRGANRSAARLLGAALERCRRGHHPELEADLLEQLGMAWLRSREAHAAGAVLLEAMGLAQAGDDAERVSRLATLLSDAAFFRGEVAEERRWLDHAAAAVAGAAGPSVLLVDAYFALLHRLPRNHFADEHLAAFNHVAQTVDDLVRSADQLPSTPRLRAQRHLALAVKAMTALDIEAMAAFAESALAAAPDEADLALRANLTLLDVTMILGDWAAVASLLDRIRRGYDRTGSSLLHWRDALATVAMHLASGAWDRAAEIVGDLEPTPALLPRNRVIVASVTADYLGRTGDLDGADRALTPARQLVAAAGDPASRFMLGAAEARLALDAGRPVPLAVGERLLRSGIRSGYGLVPFALGAEVVALAGGIDDADRAAAVLRRMGPPGTLPDAVAYRVEGLARSAGEPAEADRRLSRAAEGFRALRMPFDAAQAELDAAPVRALTDRDGAVATLQEAVATFDRLGAARHGQLARRRLRDLGSRAATTRRPGPRELTGRESEVAELVGQGLSNGEVAERLCISLRTVTSHLDHIYARLGIGSRAELARHLAGHP